jgi:hypothetical protein
MTEADLEIETEIDESPPPEIVLDVGGLTESTPIPIEATEIPNEIPVTDSEGDPPIATGEEGAPPTATDEGELVENPETPTPQEDFENFKKALEFWGLDIENYGGDIREFQKLCDEIGITDLLNNEDLKSAEVERLVRDRLVEVENKQKGDNAGWEKFKHIALFVGVEFTDWLGESLPDTLESGMLRLIKAFIEGAGFNSASSIHAAQEKEKDGVMSAGDFFGEIKGKPLQVVDKIKSADRELRNAGWDIGEENRKELNDVNGPEEAKKALQAVLVDSLGGYLDKYDHYDRWQGVSVVLAKEFGKTMLSLDIKKTLEDIHDGNDSPTQFFG